MKRTYLKSMLSFVIVLTILLANVQIFRVSAYITGWDYSKVYLRNLACGKYVDIASGNIANGSDVVLNNYHHLGTQLWGVYKLANGNCVICSEVDSNYVISVQGSVDANNTKLVLKYITSNSYPIDTQFTITEQDVGVAYIRSCLNTSSQQRLVGCSSANVSDGANIMTINNNGGTYAEASNMLWVVEAPDRSTPLNSWSLVDIAGHCDWDSESQYNSMVIKATNSWNECIGRDVFRPDAWNIIEDVKIKDVAVDPTGKGIIRRTYSNSLLDHGSKASTIEFYIDMMNVIGGDIFREKVVMHELGHALGLSENRSSDDSQPLGNIMQQGKRPYGTIPSLDDKESVEEAAGVFDF